MSFQWDRIGTFDTANEAETWCDRQNVDRRDREIKPCGEDYELRIRAGTNDDAPRWRPLVSAATKFIMAALAPMHAASHRA